jgi:hypothetical protein
LDARIIRFWRSDAILEMRSATPAGEHVGGSMTRIPGRPPPDRELLFGYLASALVNFEW